MASKIECEIMAIAEAELAAERARMVEAIQGRRKQHLPTTSTNTATLSDLVPARKSSTTRAPQSTSRPGDGSPDTAELPVWYSKLTRTNIREPALSDADTKLRSLKECIRKCKAEPHADHALRFRQIRENLHAIAFLKVSPQLLRNHSILHPGTGLPQLYDSTHSGDVSWPHDITADAREQYTKWSRGVFETDLMRGIIAGRQKRKGRNGEPDIEATPSRLDASYNGKVNANRPGHNGLVNGQWWPTRLAALRDGAHGASQAGIHGDAAKGAFSCVLSAGKEYQDEDHGEWLWYCGTDSLTGEVTDLTKLMLLSEENSRPVRLLRSAEAAWKSSFAPKRGLRYDGLYRVAGHERIDSEFSARQRHRFRLVREVGQDPIRWSGLAARPTKEEVNVYDNRPR